MRFSEVQSLFTDAHQKVSISPGKTSYPLISQVRNVYPDIAFDFKDLTPKSGSAISKFKVSNHDDFIEFTVKALRNI